MKQSKAIKPKHDANRRTKQEQNQTCLNYALQEGGRAKLNTYYVWVGGSCDYGHEERCSAGAYIMTKGEERIEDYVISDDHTTEFRMILTVMIHAMEIIPEGSDIVIMTNVAYIQNYDRLTPKCANPDLIEQCIESKKRHNNISVKIVPYHKSPLLIETHDTSTEAMKKHRQEYQHDK